MTAQGTERVLWLSVAQTAAAMGLSQTTVYRGVDDGSIPSRMVRGSIVGRAGGTVEHGPVDEHGNVTHLLVNVPERGPDR